MFLVHLETVHLWDSLLSLKCCWGEFQADEPAMLNDCCPYVESVRLEKLGPVTLSYLLTKDFDARSIWQQGCTAQQVSWSLSWAASLSSIIIIGFCRWKQYVHELMPIQSEALIGESAPAAPRMIVLERRALVERLQFRQRILRGVALARSWV